MPFLGQDWRSPGEQWVRSGEGWERLRMWRLKLLENLNENMLARLLRMAMSEGTDRRKDIGSCQCNRQPYVYLARMKMHISVSEAFSHLDMSGGIKDLKRFNYICKLLQVLIRHKMNSLSGTAQKHLFLLLDEVLKQVMKTQNNVHVMKGLLDDVREALDKGHYDHVGSAKMWARHYETLDRMQNTLNGMQIKERKDDGVTLSDLPDDCLRHIIRKLSDHQDIVNTGLSQARMQEVSKETWVWRGLCLFHFDNVQLQTVVRKHEKIETVDWQAVYTRLQKRYGMKDAFADMLHLCRGCNAIFWQGLGHPCLVTEGDPPSSVPVSPVMCVELFTN